MAISPTAPAGRRHHGPRQDVRHHTPPCARRPFFRSGTGGDDTTALGFLVHRRAARTEPPQNVNRGGRPCTPTHDARAPRPRTAQPSDLVFETRSSVQAATVTQVRGVRARLADSYSVPGGIFHAAKSTASVPRKPLSAASSATASFLDDWQIPRSRGATEAWAFRGRVLPDLAGPARGTAHRGASLRGKALPGMSARGG